MKIAAVSYRTPSRKLSNDDLIEHIAAQNPDVSLIKKAPYLQLAKKLLEKTGAETRYWRDTQAGEKAADLILGAMDDALAKAQMNPADIDLVIYCGVGKGFLEPANAYFYADAKGMHSANCFDITDACMSWVRALQTAYLMLRAGAFKTVMIVNGEFHLGFHDNWEIRSLSSLEHTFPMYTIGEAATATILVPSDDDWQFDYASRPDLVDLCTIPLQGYDDFVDPSERIGLNGINRFVSFGRELLQEAVTLLGDLIVESISDPNSKSLYFPHAPSKSVYEDNLCKYGVPIEKAYLKVFSDFGNLVSASIPVGLCQAEKAGLLARGDRIAFIPASAGMVASVVQLTY